MSQQSIGSSVSGADLSGESKKTGKKAILAGGIGTFMEGYDFVIYGYFAATLGQLFFPSDDATVSLLAAFAGFAVAFFFRPVGAFVAGHFGDRYGRRVALVVLIIATSVATAVIGMLPTYDSIGIAAPVLLVLCRCVQGLSYGGEYSGGASFMIEHAKSQSRGLVGSIMPVSSGLGIAAGGAFALILSLAVSEQTILDWAWRLPFLVALPMGIFGLYFRAKIEETPSFKSLAASNNLERKPIRAAFAKHKRSMLVVFGYATTNGIAFFLFATFFISYMSETIGLERADALLIGVMSMLFYCTICPIAGWTSDRLGRKRTLLFVCTGWICVPVPTLLLVGQAGIWAFLGMALFGIVLAFGSTLVTIIQVELFPAEVRFSASAISYNMSFALFGGTSPFVAALLVDRTGNTLSPAFYVSVMACFSLAIVFFAMQETFNKPLDDIQGPA